MVSMPNKVRLARTMLGVTQSAVAEATGLTSPQLSDIERGEYKDIPLENTRALSRYFFDSDDYIADLFPQREAVA